MRGYLDAGYTHVKLKIGGASLAEDLRRIDAVVDEVGDAGRVAVDANGRFALEAAPGIRCGASTVRAVVVRGARRDPLDFEVLRAVASAYPGALATGENLFSLADVRNLSATAACVPTWT